MKNKTVQLFWNKVQKSDNCWTWLAQINVRGYGVFWDGSKTVPAHRFSYLLHKGDYDRNLTLDHLCRNPMCVNPEHLEPVTFRENLLRGESPMAKHAVKTHCPQGHPYSGDNLYIHNNQRFCKTCRSQRNNA